jgi:hypothetical protein
VKVVFFLTNTDNLLLLNVGVVKLLGGLGVYIETNILTFHK